MDKVVYNLNEYRDLYFNNEELSEEILYSFIQYSFKRNKKIYRLYRIINSLDVTISIEDCCQEIFLKTVDYFNEKKTCTSWIIANKLTDDIRKLNATKRKTTNSFCTSDSDIDWMEDESVATEDSIINKIYIEDLLTKCSQLEKELVHEYYFLGLTQNEISEKHLWSKRRTQYLLNIIKRKFQ